MLAIAEIHAPASQHFHGNDVPTLNTALRNAADHTTRVFRLWQLSAQPVFSEPSSEPLCCGFATSLWVITFAQLMTLDPLNIVAD